MIEKRRIYTIIEACALAGMTVFMLAFASRQSFWLDELDWSIGVITGKSVLNGRLFTGMFQILLEQGYDLPLFYIIEKPFYELLPYGEVFLLIPSIVFVVLGIVILGKVGTLIGDEDAGFVTVCIAVSSATLMIQGGWELRFYSITFCFSALAMLMYAKRRRTETNKNIFLYGVSLILLLFSHWFGSILALFYAFMDLCLYIRKKIALRCILSYLLAGTFIVPWFLLMLFHHVYDLSVFWAPPPSIIAPIVTIAWLLSAIVPYCLCFGIGFVIILIGKITKSPEEIPNIRFTLIAGIICVIVPVWIYSMFINRNGAFYVDRYFFVVMPHVFLVTGCGFLEVFRAVKSRFFALEYKRKYLYGPVVLLFFVICFHVYQKAYSRITSINEPYREVAEYLAKDIHVYDNNALVVCSGSSAWIDYYFNKRGFRIPDTVAIYRMPAHYQKEEILLFVEDGEYTQPRVMTEEQLSRYDYVYLFQVHDRFTEAFVSTLEETHPLVEERTEFVPAMPKIPMESFLKRAVKDALHIRAVAPRLPFSLRLYAKAP